jgi:hypothetical protein
MAWDAGAVWAQQGQRRQAVMRRPPNTAQPDAIVNNSLRHPSLPGAVVHRVSPPSRGNPPPISRAFTAMRDFSLPLGLRLERVFRYPLLSSQTPVACRSAHPFAMFWACPSQGSTGQVGPCRYPPGGRQAQQNARSHSDLCAEQGHTYIRGVADEDGRHTRYHFLFKVRTNGQDGKRTRPPETARV